MKKRILSALLALSMTAGLAAPAWASEPEEATAQLYGQVVDGGTIVTSAGPGISLFGLAEGTVDLASGAHEKWFDRLAPETKYATLANTFYRVLEEGADNDGTDDFLIKDQYFTTSGTSVGTDDLDTLTPGQFVNASFQYTDETDNFTGIYVGTVAKNDADYTRRLITAAYNAFDRDHPEVFWLSGRSRDYYVTDENNVYLFFTLWSGENPFSVREDGYDESTIKSKSTDRDAWIAAIQGSITGYSSMSDYEKVRAFDNWLTNHNEYNTSGDLSKIGHETRECLSALEGRTGENGPVCEGYARAFKVLCDQAGIPCVLVDGIAKSSPDEVGEGGAHMWNNAQIEGKWYGVDVTWDDPIGGDGGAISGVENQSWLLVGSNTQVSGIAFGASHPVSNTVSTETGAVAFTNGPNLESEKFEPTLKASDFTVILPASDVYDGQAHAARVEPAAGVDYDGEIKIFYRLSGSGAAPAETAPTNAGTYDILIDAAADAGHNWGAAEKLAVGTLTIRKANPNLAVAAVNAVVDGAAVPEVTLPGDADRTKLSYSIPAADAGIATVDPDGTVHGVAAGSTTITVTFAGDSNYNEDEASAEVTVGVKLKTTVSFETVTLSTDYTGSSIPLSDKFSAAAADPVEAGGRITYEFDGRIYSSLSELPAVTNAGVYTVKAVYDSERYHGEKSAAFTVNQAEQAAALTITSAQTVKFGETLTLTAAGGDGDGAVSFSITAGSEAAEIVGGSLVPKKVGTVTVTAVKAGDVNHKPKTSEPVTITITQADAPTVTPIEEEVLYDASQAEIELTGGPSDQGDVTEYAVSVTTDTDGIVKGTPAAADGKLTITLADGLDENDVGKTAVITVTVTSENYLPYDIVVTIELTNKLAQNALTITSRTEIVFPNTLQLTVSGGSGTGTVTYRVTEGGEIAEISGDQLTPKKVGTVTVVATKKGDDTYRDVSSEPVVITIVKGVPQITPVYTAITASGKTLADARLSYTTKTAGLTGVISWDSASTTAVQPNVSYRWTFTPDKDNSSNYTTATGSIVLWNYTPPASGGSEDSSSSSDDSVTTNGGSTIAKPVTTTSGGVVSAAVSKEMGEQLVGQAVRTKSELVTIAPEIKRDAESVKIAIPAAVIQDLDDRTEASLKVATPVASVVIPNGALTGLASRGDVTVSASKSGGVVSVDISAGSSKLSQVDGGLTVEVPAANCVSGTVAIMVNPDGSSKVIRKSFVASTGNAVVVPLDGSAQIRIADNSKIFTDMASSAWASSAVSFISSREIMNGTGSSTFSPSEPMTRGMLALVLHNIEDNPKAASASYFSDVNSTWYTEAVQWAAGEGIVSGYSDGRFGPNDMVTREQLAVMLYRYAGQPAPSGYNRTFLDSDEVSSWASDAIRWAVGAGILSGSEGYLNPGGQATRAEAASMLMRFMLSMER